MGKTIYGPGRHRYIVGQTNSNCRHEIDKQKEKLEQKGNELIVLVGLHCDGDWKRVKLKAVTVHSQGLRWLWWVAAGVGYLVVVVVALEAR